MTTTTPKLRGVAFSDWEAKAFHEGRKTQFRQIIKPQPPVLDTGEVRSFEVGLYHPERADKHGQIYPADETFGIWGDDWDIVSPFQPGDRLYVKEAWGETCDEYGAPIMAYRAGGTAIIGARRPKEYFLIDGVHGEFDLPDRWQSARTMPPWAARTFLEVVSVRVERLNQISEDDAQYEGAKRPILGPSEIDFGDGQMTRVHPPTGYYRDGFKEAWEHKHGPNSFDDRFVWVVGVKKVTQ